MAVLDHGVNLAGDKVDAGQQGDRAVALVFMVAGEGRMNAGLGRQIRETSLQSPECRAFRRRRRSPPGCSASASTAPPPSLAVSLCDRRTAPRPFFPQTQDHASPGSNGPCAASLPRKSRILHNVPCARFARHRVPFGGTVLASVAGEQPRGPQFMRITQLFRLPARQRRQQVFASSVIVGSRPGRGRSSSAAIGPSATARSNTALDRLMVQPECLAHREKRRVFPITQQDPRALNPARRFGSRPRYHPQLLYIRIFRATIQSPAATPPYHYSLRPKPLHRIDRSLKRQLNPTHMTTFLESIV